MSWDQPANGMTLRTPLLDPSKHYRAKHTPSLLPLPQRFLTFTSQVVGTSPRKPLSGKALKRWTGTLEPTTQLMESTLSSICSLILLPTECISEFGEGGGGGHGDRAPGGGCRK